MSADNPDLLYLALNKTLEAFFEGHGLSLKQQLDFIKQAYADRARPARKRLTPSRVKIKGERDIARMWAMHEKKTRK